MTAGGPLSGVTVVALEQAVAAPLCTRTLGDLGARVIKIENPRGGDFLRYLDDVVHGLSAHFTWVNRGKESVTLDVKAATGLELLHRLLEHADVLVSNLSPGTTARLGISPPDLAERHPDLIAVEIDGYGPGGPLSHKRAYDLLVQAEAGSCAVTGTAGAPAKPGSPVADVTTGLYAAISIMAMLRDRDRGVRRTPAAPTAEISLFDTMTELMGPFLTWSQHTGLDQEPQGVGSPAVAPYSAYATADGRTVVLGTTNDQEWQRLARRILVRPDLADDPRFTTNPQRVRARAFLDGEIAAWCARHDLAEIQKTADDAGIGNSRLSRPTEVVAHPHLVARDRWRPIQTPGGPTRALLPPPVIAGYEAPMGAVPALGEHTDAVLTGLGMTAAEIGALRETGAIG